MSVEENLKLDGFLKRHDGLVTQDLEHALRTPKLAINDFSASEIDRTWR